MCKISFRTHGRIDMGLAALTANLPSFMGFEEEGEERFFFAQSLAEATVVGMTDFNDYQAHEEYRGLEA